MIQLIYAVTLAVLISTASIADARNNSNEELAAYMLGTYVGSSLAGRPQVPALPYYHIQNPLDEGGSLNPHETEVTRINEYGHEETTVVREWTDFYGRKHIEIEEY